MQLFKFTTDEEIARIISKGVYRYYELPKYRKVEQDGGRSDRYDSSICFKKEEYLDAPEKLPVAYFNNVPFKFTMTDISDDYLKQYFVFCMSTDFENVPIEDSKFVVTLHKENFDLFEKIINPPWDEKGGLKVFSHGMIEYYDIDNQPKSIVGKRWREVYLKHSDFSSQREYRSAFFISDDFFHRTHKQPYEIRRKIYTTEKEPYDFDLMIIIRAGIDQDGWRYLELDFSEFSAKMGISHEEENNSIIRL